MMKPPNSDMNVTNEDEQDDAPNHGVLQKPCHHENGTTEPFAVESPTAVTFEFSHHDSHRYRSKICCCCCHWLQRKIPAMDHLRKNWKVLALGQLISFS